MLTYRPEIDGLRTLAVVSVLLYHAELFIGRQQFFSGGYLGVDVFFVISGFLITGILLKELQQTGRISIARFYERRARRLLPALLVVIIASLPLAWHFLLPSELINYAWSVLSSQLFGSNIFWHYSLQEYGAQSALLKPFLHTWSLAVEEQYYIVFPILLGLLFRYFRRYLLLVIAAGIVISLEFSVWMTTRDSSFSFYMLPSRFWELLAGAALAIVMSQSATNLSNSSTFLSRLAPGLGIVMIVWAIVYIDFESRHPGYITLIPVLGTLLVIAYAHKDDVVTQILSSRVFVGVGLISYSLYLWHYPVFAFGRIADSTPTWHDKLQWFVFTFLLSILTYFLLEKPFRDRNKVALRTFLSVIIAATVLVTALLGYWVFKEGLSDRLPPIIQKALKSDRTDRFATEFGAYLVQYQIENVFLLGDSHAAILEPEIRKVLPSTTQVHDLTKGGCPFLPNFDRLDRGVESAKKCTSEYQTSRLQTLRDHPPSLVIVASRLPLYFSGKTFLNSEHQAMGGAVEEQASKYEFRHSTAPTESREQLTGDMMQAFKQGIEALAQYGHSVVLIYPVPEVGENVPAELNKLLQGVELVDVAATLTESPITTSYRDYQHRSKESFAVLDEIKTKKIYRVYPHQWLCNDKVQGLCMTHDDMEVYYTDDNHLSAFQRSILLDEVAKELIGRARLEQISVP